VKVKVFGWQTNVVDLESKDGGVPSPDIGDGP